MCVFFNKVKCFEVQSYKKTLRFFLFYIIFPIYKTIGSFSYR